MPFQSLQPNEIAALAGKSIIHKYPSNSVIIKQGDKPENAYYVKSGRLKVKN
jgi:cAMP-binding proteins - catabolite gene activator and regulatory subunit of cAMP-dependent protein kinases